MVLTIPIVVVLDRIECREFKTIDDVKSCANATHDYLVLSIVGSLLNIRNWVPRVEVIRLIVTTVFMKFRIILIQYRIIHDRHCWIRTNSLIQVIVVSPSLIDRSIREVVCEFQTLVQCLLVSCETSIDLLEVRVDDHTLETTVTSRSTEVEVLITTRDRHIVCMRNWSACDSLHPIGVTTHIGTTTCSHHVFAILFSGQYAWSISHNSCINRTVVLSVELTIFRTTFSGNKDDTGIGTCTIDSGSRTIFQHIDRLNIRRKNR